MIIPNERWCPPRDVRVPTADAMRDLGRDLAKLLRAGDLVILVGPLGAGKTTLVQGIGTGLGIRGPVTSPDLRHRPGAPGRVRVRARRWCTLMPTACTASPR